MKRFKSPFQKIQRIHEQLLRIAGLKMAQAQTAVLKANDQIRRLEAESADAEHGFVRQFSSQTLNVCTRDILAARSCLECCRANIRIQTDNLERLTAELIKVQSDYRKLKARCEGIANVLQKQKTEHRQMTMQYEQTELDESARVVKQSNEYNNNFGDLTIAVVK